MASAGEIRPRNESAPFFDCSICLDFAVDPVVTLCGHLYCWPCIYKWLHRHGHIHCPVCNSPLSSSSLVPLYGRGSKPASSSRDPSVPHRPRRPRRPRRADPDPEARYGYAPAALPMVHSIFGSAAVAAMVVVGLPCTDPYRGAYGGAEELDEDARSLHRISGFLLCCAFLCLLLF